MKYLSNRDRKRAIASYSNNLWKSDKRKLPSHRQQALVISTHVLSEPDSFKAMYHNFISSDYWKRKRISIIKEGGNKCSICLSAEFLNVHHICYDDVFTSAPEKRGDLIVVCQYHHHKFHDLYGLKRNMRKEWDIYVENERKLITSP